VAGGRRDAVAHRCQRRRHPEPELRPPGRLLSYTKRLPNAEPVRIAASDTQGKPLPFPFPFPVAIPQSDSSGIAVALPESIVAAPISAARQRRRGPGYRRGSGPAAATTCEGDQHLDGFGAGQP